ncbi:MAG: hypothetical protein BZ138_05905 [Methanosphaera sp. rholeuAM270]|nr:MAG: hypothetical protein BZ138_05905 [Methanosphaera sp. rholeuAM270]
MMTQDINEAINILNSPEMENKKQITITYTDGVTVEIEITKEKPYTAHAYSEEYLGVMTGYLEDLENHGGIRIDGKLYDFVEMEYE